VRQIAGAAAELLTTGRTGRVGRVVAMRGFGGRRAGQAILVQADGTSTGQLLGGAADSSVRGATGAIGLFDLAIGDMDAVAAGLACGGVATVLFNDIEAVPAPAWEALSTGQAIALVTRADAEAVASSVFALVDDPVTGALQRYGSLGDPALDEIAARAARLALRRGRDVAEIQDHEGSSLVLEVWLTSTTLIVVGEGQLAEALSTQGALLGWAVVTERAWGQETEADIQGLGLTDAVVVLSHDPDVDTPALAAALSTECFVGALGSRHTQAGRCERLSALGIGAERTDRIHGPVGLDLGARSPEETAVAIVAEILAHRSGRGARSLSATTGPING
jgi:xanthine dehydrogenase accessory factor